jgi:hypothetical protein
MACKTGVILAYCCPKLLWVPGYLIAAADFSLDDILSFFMNLENSD